MYEKNISASSEETQNKNQWFKIKRYMKSNKKQNKKQKTKQNKVLCQASCNATGALQPTGLCNLTLFAAGSANNIFRGSPYEQLLTLLTLKSAKSTQYGF